MTNSHIWHPYTRFSQAPFTNIVRAEGIYVYDDKGKAYLDAVSSWWCVNLGHSHPRIVAAIQDQAATLQHSILGNLSHPMADQLAHDLAALMPSPDRHVMYASDGACANEIALKVCVQYFSNIGQPERNLFLSLTEPYHGDTIGTVSVGFMEHFHAPFKNLVFPTVQVDPISAQIEAAIGQHADTLAGVILEPLCQGAAGMRMYAPDVLQAAAAACKQHGIPLIIDEIAMGYGRTGKMFAFEHAGIDPDIVTLGKGISNGTLPISAAVVKDHMYDTFSDEPRDHTFYHGHTFAGNPIAAAAAVETLRIYREEHVLDAIQPTIDALSGIAASWSSHPLVSNVRSLGMIAAFETPSPDTAQQVAWQMKEMGVFIRPLGPTLYLIPPLVTPIAALEEISEKLGQALCTID